MVQIVRTNKKEVVNQFETAKEAYEFMLSKRYNKGYCKLIYKGETLIDGNCHDVWGFLLNF